MQLVSVTEIARRLGVSRSTVYEMLERGDLPQPLRVGGLPRFDMDEVLRFIQFRTATQKAAR